MLMKAHFYSFRIATFLDTVFFPGVKPPGRNAGYLPPFSAKINIEWSNTSAHPVCLRSVHRDIIRTFLKLNVYKFVSECVKK